MRKLSIVKLFLLLGMLSAASAHATITLNGIRYDGYWANTTKCPDGSAKLLYQGKYYCPSYSALVSWKAPVTRTNGGPLLASDISSYEIYWTREQDASKGVITRSKYNKAALFSSRLPGTYHFAMSVVDTAGLKSPLSTVVSAKLGK